MKRFVLIFRIFILGLLMVLISAGCHEFDEWAEVSKDKVMVGEPVKLSVLTQEGSSFGCEKPRLDSIAGDMYSWSVDPSNGATVKDGVFVASKPGKYNVTPVGILTAKPRPRTITVEGTAAETFTTETMAAETTAAEATTTIEPDETTTETDATSTETDANLIHGVVPTKVTAHGNSTSADGVWESNFEFWNVGKLGGEQYAEATMRAVLVEKAEGSTISDSEKTEEWEGYFTGGPNGTLYLSIMYEGMLTEIQLTLKDGKVISNAFEQGDIPMDNPDAFNGWID